MRKPPKRYDPTFKRDAVELLIRRTGGFCERLRGLAGANLLPFEKALLDENLERISFLLEPEPEDAGQR